MSEPRWSLIEKLREMAETLREEAQALEAAADVVQRTLDDDVAKARQTDIDSLKERVKGWVK